MQKDNKPNRIRDTLSKLYDQQPPHFREQLQRFREDPTSRVFAPLAESYRRMGRLEEAIQICQTGLEHHPDFHGGRVALAKCYFDKKQYADCIAEVERVAQIVPENLLAQRLLGEAHLQLQNIPESIAAFKMALMLAPNDVALASKIHQLEKSNGAMAMAPALAAEPALTAQATALWEGPAEELEIVAVAPLDGATPDWESPAPVPSDLSVPEEDLAPIEDHSQQVEAILGVNDDEDEAFSVAPVSQLFEAEKVSSKKEITTETLGDLYYSQGQFLRSLRIFDKIASKNPTPELSRKMDMCRARLGVDNPALLRKNQMDLLRGILNKVRQEKQPTSSLWDAETP